MRRKLISGISLLALLGLTACSSGPDVVQSAQSSLNEVGSASATQKLTEEGLQPPTGAPPAESQEEGTQSATGGCVVVEQTLTTLNENLSGAPFSEYVSILDASFAGVEGSLTNSELLPLWNDFASAARESFTVSAEAGEAVTQQALEGSNTDNPMAAKLIAANQVQEDAFMEIALFCSKEPTR